tara:strand:- start:127 stop:528 length:402 start_codon:yes stop_codon:yes gene_type:complete
MSLINALTNEPLDFNWNICSGDNKSYVMFPDHTKVKAQLIDDVGNYIKVDGTPGEELVWCKICDQRCFRSDILYCVMPLQFIDKKGNYNMNNCRSTRASLIVEPGSKILTAQSVPVNNAPSIDNVPIAEATPI